MRFKSEDLQKGILYRDILFRGTHISFTFILVMISLTFIINFLVLGRSLEKAVVATGIPFFYLLFSIFLTYLITRKKTLHKTIYLGLFSFYVFSYFLSTLFILLLLHGHMWQVIYNVWGAYTLAMSSLMIYYITYSLPRTIASILVSAAILVLIGEFAIDWHILVISFCILMIPTLLISMIMEGRGVKDKKMSYIAKAYFESFLGNYRAIEGIQELVASYEEMQSDIIGIEPPRFYIVCNDIHYGPYREVSGSSMPGEIAEKNPRIITVKAPSTHRENLASSRYKNQMIKAILEEITELKYREAKTALVTVEEGEVRVTIQSLGKVTLCVLDFNSEGYDDIPREVLLELRKILPEGIFIDAHSSRARDRKLKDIDESILESFKRAVSKGLERLEKMEENDLKASFYSVHPEFSELGKAGMYAFLLSNGKKGCLYFIFDSNNIVFDVKKKIREEFEGNGIVVEVISTDSHEKTSPSGLYNSLGHATPLEKILKECHKAYEELMKSLRPARVAHRRIFHDVKILGDTWLSMLQMVFQNVKLMGYLIGFQAVLMMILITLFIFVL